MSLPVSLRCCQSAAPFAHQFAQMSHLPRSRLFHLGEIRKIDLLSLPWGLFFAHRRLFLQDHLLVRKWNEFLRKGLLLHVAHPGLLESRKRAIGCGLYRLLFLRARRKVLDDRSHAGGTLFAVDEIG